MSGTNFKRERVDFGNTDSYLFHVGADVINYNDDGGTPNTFYGNARPLHRGSVAYSVEPSLSNIPLDGYNRCIFACGMQQLPTETIVSVQFARDPAAADNLWIDAITPFQPVQSADTGTVLGDMKCHVQDPCFDFAALTDQAEGVDVNDLLYARIKVDAAGGGGAKNFYWMVMLTQSMNAAQSIPPRGQAFGG